MKKKIIELAKIKLSIFFVKIINATFKGAHTKIKIQSLQKSNI